ncbi:hypothetical protein [Nitrosococcus watsonii]|uniref:Transmembrane protein n=1 Tax=Nitrosococcus watsoni (strain C-113) TaxID=105559 RepID=D8KCD5_NITWC|nr:hypothetical protein [Nitrosococcus watsonii]ADJ29876.1 hypothetical protein Nwat_3159 [Nitrosococcus watsonii C-113]
MCKTTLHSNKELERFKAKLASESELLKATAAFEHAALRPLYLLNGGALIAFMALYGAIVRTTDTCVQIDHPWAKGAMVIWTIGLAFAVFVTVSAYCSQFAFLKHIRRKLEADKASDDDNPHTAGEKEGEATCWGDKGKKHRRWAMGFWLASITLFIIGVAVACFSLSNIHRLP